jgi:hypothetical protein
MASIELMAIASIELMAIAIVIDVAASAGCFGLLAQVDRILGRFGGCGLGLLSDLVGA